MTDSLLVRAGCATRWATGKHKAATCGHHHLQCCITLGCHDACSHLCDTELSTCNEQCNPLCCNEVDCRC